MSNKIIYSRNFIVYKIVYIPWENNTEGRPWKYIGSTKKDLSVYFGQIRSRKWKDFWKSEVKNNPHNFRKTVLCVCITGDSADLLGLELELQKDNNAIKSNVYFNEQYAQKNGYFGRDVQGPLNPMYGIKRSNDWKEKISIIQKITHNTKEYKEKASIKQKEVQSRPSVAKNKSIKQKAKWGDPTQKLSNSLLILTPRRQKSLFPYEFDQIGKMREFIKENNLSNSAVEMQNTLEEAVVITKIIRTTQLGGQNRKLIIDFILNKTSKIPKSLHSYISTNYTQLSDCIKYLQNCSIDTRAKFCSSLK